MRSSAAFVCALAAGDVVGLRSDLTSNLDWDEVAELAENHQVEALCWWQSVQLQNVLELPQVLHDRWRLGYLHQRLRNEALVEQLASLHDSLSTTGVEALFLKGPWMAFHAYPEAATRPIGDIDLCVREEHYDAAVAALRRAGWSCGENLPGSPQEALYASHYRQQLRFAARGRRPVELHFRLLNMGPPGPPEHWLWDNAREVQVGSIGLQVPGPEAMLLHSLLHANQHGFSVLRLLHDIRWCLEADGPKVDFERFCLRVGQLGCETSCYFAFQLASELAGAVLPEGVDTLRPWLPRRLLFTLLWHLDAARRLKVDRRHQEVEAPLFYLLEMGRLIDKLRYVKAVTAAMGGPRPLVREVARLMWSSSGGVKP